MDEEIQIPLSGDPEQDRLDYEAAVLHYRRVKEGICPNGCGALRSHEASGAVCPTCDFQMWTSDQAFLELLEAK